MPVIGLPLPPEQASMQSASSITSVRTASKLKPPTSQLARRRKRRRRRRSPALNMLLSRRTTNFATLARQGYSSKSTPSSWAIKGVTIVRGKPTKITFLTPRSSCSLSISASMLSPTSSNSLMGQQHAEQQHVERSADRVTKPRKSSLMPRSKSFPPECTNAQASSCNVADFSVRSVSTSSACSSSMSLPLPGIAAFTVSQPSRSPRSSGHVRRSRTWLRTQLGH
mmetsp:Transcript_45137/g.79435  ORF Transcript_45137/g.79435 Transcript_45137/m.79435 type:complete len:225 (+) Transcript_45137:268-942(+)